MDKFSSPKIWDFNSPAKPQSSKTKKRKYSAGAGVNPQAVYYAVATAGRGHQEPPA